MKIRSQSGTMVFWLSIIVFTVSVTGISHSAVIDKATVEVAYLFDEGKGNVAKDISGNGRDGDISGAKHVKGVIRRRFRIRWG